MKMAIKIVALVAMLLIGLMADSTGPVIDNALAMTQLENSSDILIATTVFNRIQPVISALYYALVCLLGFSIARDLVIFAKSSNH